MNKNQVVIFTNSKECDEKLKDYKQILAKIISDRIQQKYKLL